MILTLSLRSRHALSCIMLLGAQIVAVPRTSQAQPTPRPAAQAPTAPNLDRPLSVRSVNAPLRDVVPLLETGANVRIRALWTDHDHADGLSPDTIVRLSAAQTPLVRVLESVVSQADPGLGGGATWQVADDGAIEIGPRSRLNAHRTLRVYDVRDLLARVPDFTDSATIDLQAALRAKSGSAAIRDAAPPAELGADDRAERARALIELIVATVEPDQWEDNGGQGATIRLYEDQLIIRAAPYIHRQLTGR